jgi:hypothetical protein
MSTNNTNPVESGLQDIRLEFVEESDPGVTPTDPQWQRFSPEVDEISASIDGTKEATSALGFRDVVEFYRGPEESELTVSYSQYEFPVGPTGDVRDPIAFPMILPEGDYPSLSVLSRRDVKNGGRLGAGFREFLVVKGARPTSSALDGDPSAAEPIPQELTLPSEVARPHIIHQPPSSGDTVVARSTDPQDAVDVVIESEDADVTETLTLPGGGASPNTVAGTEPFGDIDAIDVQGEHNGDIQVGTDDGSGGIDTELLENPLTGLDRDGVTSQKGVPALGGGSHSSPQSGQGTIFLGTQTSFAGESLGRLHALDLSVEVDSSREPVQSSRRQRIDIGQRTVEFDADLAGPFKSASLIKEHFRDKSGDLIYGFDSDPTVDPANAEKRIVAHNVEIIDAPDFTRTAGDTNFIPGVTFRATADQQTDQPAIEIINNS